MPLRHEQRAAVAPEGRPEHNADAPPALERAGGAVAGDQVMAEGSPEPKRRKQPLGPTEEERVNHEITHVVFRSWCRLCVASRAKEDPHERSDVREGAVPKVTMDWLFFTSDAEPEVMLPCASDLRLGHGSHRSCAGRQGLQRCFG